MSLFKRLVTALRSGSVSADEWDQIRANLITSDLGVKLVDEVIKEPINGAHRSQEEIFETVKQYIKKTIAELEPINVNDRINQRIDKFCKMGVWE